MGKNLLKDNLGWFALGANVVVAIIVPILVISKTGTETIPLLISLIMSFLSFIVLSCIELLIHKQMQKNEIAWWKINNKSDLQLHNIRINVHDINKEASSDENDLFYFYVHKKIEELQELSKDAITHHEIKIEETMLDTTIKMYESAFNGQDTDIFRPLYLCNSEANDFFFNSGFTRLYFQLASDMVSKDKIKQIKRLFVYTTDTDLQDNRIQRLILFHKNNKNYDCKKLSMNAYNVVKNDFKLHELTASFGIYGKKYLYTERTENINRIVGYYSKEEAKIQRYINFFDKCWDFAENLNISEDDTMITIESIFSNSKE